MNTLHTLLEGKRVGLLTAHPDDHVTVIHAVAAAQEAAAETHEYTLTKGRNSTLNYLAGEGFDVGGGDRALENMAAALHLGFTSLQMLDATDGNLAAEAGGLIPRVTSWIQEKRLNLLLTVGGIHDHPDHVASGRIGRIAAARAFAASGQPVDILEGHIHPGGDMIVVESTLASIGAALKLAAVHRSQFQISQEHKPGWPRLLEGFSIHPDTLAGLKRYPIAVFGAYRHCPAGSLATAKAAQPEFTLATNR